MRIEQLKNARDGITYSWSLSQCASESCGGSGGFKGSAVACAEASEVFERVEAAFDSVALFIEFAVVSSGAVSGAWAVPDTKMKCRFDCDGCYYS